MTIGLVIYENEILEKKKFPALSSEEGKTRYATINDDHCKKSSAWLTVLPLRQIGSLRRLPHV